MRISFNDIKTSELLLLNNFEIIIDGDRREVILSPKMKFRDAELEEIIEFFKIKYNEW